MTLLDSRLKLATKSQEEFIRTQQALRDSSLQTGLGLEDQIKGYTQLERSTRAMGLSSQQLTFLTESFGKAAVVSGADAASYQSALTQLNQGFASGVIRGQEFNSVAEQAPAIMEALANGLRGSNKEFDDLEKKGYLGVAALRKMAGEGKLVNSVTIPALIEGLKETNKQFDQMPLTVQRATEKLSTAYKIWISDQNNAVAGTSSLANAIGGLATNFSTVASVVTNSAIAIAAVVGGKLISSLVAATKQTSLYRLATIGSVEQEILSLKSKTALTAATVAQAEADLAAVRAKTVSGIASKELVAAEIAHGRAMVANSAATASYEAAVARATTAQKGFNVALSAFGGWVGVAATAFLAVIAYWDDIDKAIQKAIKSKKYFQSLTTKDFIGQEGAQTLADAEKKLAEVQKKRQALSSQRNTQTLPPQLQNYVGGEAAARSMAQQSFAAQDRELMLEESALRKVINDAKQARAEEFAAMRRQEVLGGDVSSTIVGGGPKPDTKVKTPKAFDSGELARVNAQGMVQALEEELKLTQELGTAKDNLNVHEIKAYQLQQQLNALNPAAKNYAQLKSNIELQLAEEKRAGVLQREIDTLQKRNKAVIDWRNEVDKLINKQQELNTFTAVDLTARATETPLEQAARKTKENYEDALKTLKEITRIRSEGDVAGASPEEINQRVSEYLASRRKQQPSSATFQDQTNVAQFELSSASQIGDISGVKTLEETKTAILEEQTRQRNALRAQESQAIQQQISTMQSGTESILSILETSGAKQTGIYKALFAVNKAFAIANSIIKIQQGIAEASSLPFPANLGAMATVAASTASIVSTIAGTDAQFAKGGAFVGGDVVSTPTTFPMSGGRTGLMGEKGAEAVMPLSRDANGRLGVTVNGGGSSSGGIVQQNKIEITVQGGNTNEETAGVISRELLRTMETIAKNQIVQAKRPGGALA